MHPDKNKGDPQANEKFAEIGNGKRDEHLRHAACVRRPDAYPRHCLLPQLMRCSSIRRNARSTTCTGKMA